MIDVRTAVAADVPTIQRVARASWCAAYGDFVTDPAIEEGIAVLASIYVLPDRWGKDVGTGLLEAAIKRLREQGFECLEATVLADNHIGVAFYDRQRFKRTGRHEEELGGETYDALVVERPL